MIFGLKDVGVFANDIQTLEDVTKVLQAICEKLGAKVNGIPNTFYGTLHELVDEGFIMRPPVDGNGKFLPPQKGRLLRTPTGQVAYLYIPDSKNAYVNQAGRNRVHMYWCGTLTRMWNENRDDRYWGTTDTTGGFGLVNNVWVKLSVCKKCYELIGGMASTYGTVDKFDFKKFSNDYCRCAPPPTIDPDTGQGVWYCCKCNAKMYELEDDAYSDSNVAYCHDCSVTRRKFAMLKNIETPDDFAKWIKMGYNVNMRDKQGITPLMYMVANNPVIPVINAMVRDYGASIKDVDNSEHSVLMHAVSRQKKFATTEEEIADIKQIVDALMKLDPSIIKQTDKKRQMAAAYAKHRDLKNYLLDLFPKYPKDTD